MLGALVILVRLTICWQAMPLFARRAADHYPDRETSPDAEQVIVLCGGLEVGGWHRVTNGPSERTWQWGVSITASSAGFLAGGSAVDEVACKVNVAVAGKRGRHDGVHPESETRIMGTVLKERTDAQEEIACLQPCVQVGCGAPDAT